MLAHDTLPSGVQTFIHDEKIKIYYLGLCHILGFSINKTIGINNNINLYKQRFAICHELGHYIFGGDSNLVGISYWKNPCELLADDFAMDLLVPKDKLMEACEEYDWDLIILEKIFGVCRCIIEKRIIKLLGNENSNNIL